MILPCSKCVFCNVFLLTNENVYPLDGDECGIYGLGKCEKVFFSYCKKRSFKSKNVKTYVQLNLFD